MQPRKPESLPGSHSARHSWGFPVIMDRLTAVAAGDVSPSEPLAVACALYCRGEREFNARRSGVMSSDSLGSQDVDCLGLAPEGELVAETDPGSENPPVTLAPGPAPAQAADAGPGTGTGSAPPPGRLSRPASAVRRRNLLVSVIPAAVALVVG